MTDTEIMINRLPTSVKASISGYKAASVNGHRIAKIYINRLLADEEKVQLYKNNCHKLDSTYKSFTGSDKRNSFFFMMMD